MSSSRTSVVVIDDNCRLVVGARLVRYSFEGWCDAIPRPRRGDATILTAPTSVGALVHGYRPVLHPTAALANRASPSDR